MNAPPCLSGLCLLPFWHTPAALECQREGGDFVNDFQHAGRPLLSHAAKRGRNHNASVVQRRILLRVLVGMSSRVKNGYEIDVAT